MSDATGQASTTLASLAWLTLKTWGANGAMVFSMTEDGDVGLFNHDESEPAALGTGDTCDEALTDAHRSYHLTPGLERCDCVQLEADGDALS